jgi:hypothetical protein
MRNILFIAACVSFLVTLSSAARLRDPIFGIQYESQNVHFEVAPAIINSQCRGLATYGSPAKLWVYAHLKRGDTEYFIVQARSSDFGTAIRLRTGRCTVVDSDRFLVEGPSTLEKQPTSIQDAAAIMTAIYKDIFQRYSRAFGGREKFLQALPAVNEEGLPPGLKKKLECYRSKQCD